MAHRNTLGRRTFLKTAAGATVGVVGFPYIVSSSIMGKADNIPPSEWITMSCISVGWPGGSNMNSFLREKDCQIVAVCDVDKIHLQDAVKRTNSIYKNKDCASYMDFSELLARKICFNPQTEEILNDQTATSLLGTSMRSPWHL